MSNIDKKIDKIRKLIKDYPNFPKEGILFRDIFPVFQNPEALESLHEVLVYIANKIQPKIECIVGLDARGFLLGPFLALALKVPFVPIRKSGKLPGTVLAESYQLEYGKDSLEIQKDSIKKNTNCIIVDDLLATGGTLSTACNLIEKLNGNVMACVVVMELTDLNGRNKISSDVISLVQF